MINTLIKLLLPVAFLFTGVSAFAAPPTAPGKPAGSIADGTVTLTWPASQDDVAVQGYNVYLNDNYVASVSETTYQTALDVGIDNTFYIVAFDTPDAAGGVREFSPRSEPVTFPAAGGGNPPQGGSGNMSPSTPDQPAVAELSSTMVTISWSASTDDIGVVGYNVYRDGGYYQTVADTTFTDQGLTPGSTVIYSVVAFDDVPNYTPQSPELVVMLPMEDDGQNSGSDTQAPSTPQAPVLTEMSNTAITIQWAASTDNVGVVGYNVYRDGNYYATVQSTSFVDTALTAQKSYSYTVVAFDEARNFTPQSDALTVSPTSEPGTPPAPETPTTPAPETPTPPAPETPTPPTADTQAPSTPQAPALSDASDTTITIQWAASTDNVGVVGYNVYRDGNYYATAQSTSFVDTAVTAQQNYSYTIVAFDEARNFTPQSEALTVSTSSVPGTDPSPPETPTPPAPETPTPPAPETPNPPAPETPNPPVPEAPGEMVPVLDPNASPIPSPDQNDPFGSTLEVDNETPVPGGPPTMPKNLRVDLVSNDWAEISWAPSNDDGEVVAYNIYRSDGVQYVVARDGTDVNPGSQAEIDKYWTTTSFIDCNYTRFDDRVHACSVNGPQPGETYTYQVSAVDDQGQESVFSPPIEITYHIPRNAPVPLYDDFYKDPNDDFAQRNDLSNIGFFLDEFDLVFSDEFNGTSLDPQKWQTQLTWTDETIINGEQQYFVPIQSEPDFGFDPFSFNGNFMSINAIPTPAELTASLPETCNETDATGNERCLFLSGALSSHDRFGFIYGYVEGRIRVGGTPGMLSSFYLYHRYPGSGVNLHAPEIDIIEYLGENPFGAEDAFQTYHFDDVNSGVVRSSPTMAHNDLGGARYSDDWHTYGVLWEPQLVIWYIDGVEVRRLSGPMVSRQPMNIVNYLVTGSAWAETPDLNDPSIYPLQMDVDYIRVFQRDAFKGTAQFGP
ncbi:MAG: family 16 glycosylhydrolase [Granulosicoccus sp.]|nr:family 16 glycosylhydrolase [Granulosicoccus sp.]